jgi:hypothetical protein
MGDLVVLCVLYVCAFSVCMDTGTYSGRDLDLSLVLYLLHYSSTYLYHHHETSSGLRRTSVA